MSQSPPFGYAALMNGTHLALRVTRDFSRDTKPRLRFYRSRGARTDASRPELTKRQEAEWNLYEERTLQLEGIESVLLLASNVIEQNVTDPLLAIVGVIAPGELSSLYGVKFDRFMTNRPKNLLEAYRYTLELLAAMLQREDCVPCYLSRELPALQTFKELLQDYLEIRILRENGLIA